MKSGEKPAPEQNNVSQAEPLRAPASIEDAYELGWQWQRESFFGLREFGTTKAGVTKREGLAYFVKEPRTDGIVIPFVATYEFGTPRHPKYPYKSGSIFSVDEEPEPPEVETPEEEEESLWKIECLYKETVLETFEIRDTGEGALNEACEAFNNEIHFRASKVSDQPSAEESPKPEPQCP
jgi:hypothetical protein